MPTSLSEEQLQTIERTMHDPDSTLSDYWAYHVRQLIFSLRYWMNDSDAKSETVLFMAEQLRKAKSWPRES